MRTTAAIEVERDEALAEIETIHRQRDAAHADADRLRAELNQARIRDVEPGPSWRVRAAAAVLVLGVFAVLVQLLFGVL